MLYRLLWTFGAVRSLRGTRQGVTSHNVFYGTNICFKYCTRRLSGACRIPFRVLLGVLFALGGIDFVALPKDCCCVNETEICWSAVGFWRSWFHGALVLYCGFWVPERHCWRPAMLEYVCLGQPYLPLFAVVATLPGVSCVATLLVSCDTGVFLPCVALFLRSCPRIFLNITLRPELTRSYFPTPVLTHMSTPSNAHVQQTAAISHYRCQGLGLASLSGRR